MRFLTLCALFAPLAAPSAALPAGDGGWQTICVCGDFLDNSPCGNATVGEGCMNSTSDGAVMTAQGAFSVTSDDVLLKMTQMPSNEFGVVFASYSTTSLIQAPFGDGILCVDGPYVRLPVFFTGTAGAFFEGPGIAGQLGIQPGDQIYFQGWYRDPSGPCGTGFNLTSGILTNWTN